MYEKNSAYDPCQPGYQQAGARYIQLDYSSDCKLGKYIIQIFEVQEPKTYSIHIIPDGCNDIIITYDGKTVAGHLSPSIQNAALFRFQNALWIFGVRFLPGATYALFKDRIDYNVQNTVDISLIFPSFEKIKNRLAASLSFVKRYELMTDFLEESIAKNSKNGDTVGDILDFCVYQLIASQGLVSVDELSEKTGYSDRYLRQLFMSHVGHSPKALGNIIRMQCASRYICSHPAPSLGEVADMFGFSDQSHMNREFRKFLGLTSGAIKDSENWIDYLKAASVRRL